MMSLKKKAAVALTVASIAAGSFAVPAMAETRGFDAARLDKAQAEYTQYRYRNGYRGHWRGSSRGNGAAVAGAIGLGILGAAAIAANRNAYAGPGYYEDDYYAPPAPVYVAPRRYYAPYGYQPYDFRDYRDYR